MMNRALYALTLGLLLLAPPALAQTTPAPTTPAAPATTTPSGLARASEVVLPPLQGEQLLRTVPTVLGQALIYSGNVTDALARTLQALQATGYAVSGSDSSASTSTAAPASTDTAAGSTDATSTGTSTGTTSTDSTSTSTDTSSTSGTATTDTTGTAGTAAGSTDTTTGTATDTTATGSTDSTSTSTDTSGTSTTASTNTSTATATSSPASGANQITLEKNGQKVILSVRQELGLTIVSLALDPASLTQSTAP